MSTTNNVHKSKIMSKLIIAEQAILYTALTVGVGFYLGTQFSAQQVARDKQIIKAALSTPAPVAAAPAAPAPK